MYSVADRSQVSLIYSPACSPSRHHHSLQHNALRLARGRLPSIHDRGHFAGEVGHCRPAMVWTHPQVSFVKETGTCIGANVRS